MVNFISVNESGVIVETVRALATTLKVFFANRILGTKV